MRTFYEYIQRLDEDLLRKTHMMDAIRKSGVPNEILSAARHVMSVNDFLENPPPEARGAYALGLSEVEGFDIYFQIAKAMGMIDWPKAYEDTFGPDWMDETDKLDVTDRFLNKILENGKNIVFFIPNNALSQHTDSRYTREEIEFFMRNPQHLRKVIFVFGTYDFVDRENLTKFVWNDPESGQKRTGPQRTRIMQDVLKNPQNHRYPEA